MSDSSNSSGTRSGGGWTATGSVDIDRLRAIGLSRYFGRGNRLAGFATTAAAPPSSGSPPGSPPGPPPGPPRSGDLIADRYRLEEQLGQGGFGSVWRALDELSGEWVAVKLYKPDRTRRHAARDELTALQCVDVPGVVRLRDGGEDHGRPFVVMDLVAGKPFPGRCGGPLREKVARLLEVLIRLHGIKIYHGDLKPENCFVDDTGQPVILDLGIARGAALGLEGTPCQYLSQRYAAPEQFVEGRVDARTDLYSVGVMVRDALPDAYTPDGPVLRRLVEALLQDDPAHRPQTAMAALTLLDEGDRFEGLPPLARAPASGDLEGLFAGPEPFLRERSQAAAALWARTGGCPDGMARELRAWLRTGTAWRGEDGLHLRPEGLARLVSGEPLALTHPHPAVSPAASDLLCWIRLAQPEAHVERLRAVVASAGLPLERALAELRAAGAAWTLPDGSLATWPQLDPAPGWENPRLFSAHHALAASLPPDHPMAVRHALAADMDAPGLLDRVATAARRLVLDGRPREAHWLLSVGLDVARRMRRPQDELSLLTVCALEALAAESSVAIRHVRYLIGRALCGSPALDQLERLLSAAQAETPKRAHELLEAIGELDDVDLERERQGLRLVNAHRTSLEAVTALLAALEPWADRAPERRRGDWLGWCGTVAYRRSDFREAGRLFGEATRLNADRKRILNWRFNQASALLEAEPASSLVAARAICDEAAHLNLPSLEFKASYIARSAEYRLGLAGPPRPADVDAAAELGRLAEAWAACVEAPAAWRWGAVDVARALARRAARRFREAKRADAADVFDALAMHCGAPVEPGALQGMVERAMAFQMRDFTVQILGLVACAWPAGALASRALEAARSGRPKHEWSNRLDVLSYDESLMMAGAMGCAEEEQGDV